MLQKTKFIFLLVVSVAIISFVHCQSADKVPFFPLSARARLTQMVKEFFNSIRELWGMQEELEASTEGMTSWTKEMLESFKMKTNEWIDQVQGASLSERDEMRDYIEQLDIPKQDQKN